MFLSNNTHFVDKYLYCANVGDSEAVLVYTYKKYYRQSSKSDDQLTFLSSLLVEEERQLFSLRYIALN
jgi:serine/threonine protein phosphatase PrpC